MCRATRSGKTKLHAPAVPIAPLMAPYPGFPYQRRTEDTRFDVAQAWSCRVRELVGVLGLPQKSEGAMVSPCLRQEGCTVQTLPWAFPSASGILELGPSSSGQTWKWSTGEAITLHWGQDPRLPATIDKAGSTRILGFPTGHTAHCGNALAVCE